MTSSFDPHSEQDGHKKVDEFHKLDHHIDQNILDENVDPMAESVCSFQHNEKDPETHQVSVDQVSVDPEKEMILVGSNTEMESEVIPNDSVKADAEAAESVLSESVFHELDPAVIKADYVVAVIGVLACIVAGILTCSIYSYYNGIQNLIGYILLGAFCILTVTLAILGYIWPWLEYRNTRWKLDKLGFEIHKGVFFKTRTSVPLARIQHMDVTQGPIERLFKLGSIVVYTAGSKFSAVTISGLTHETAKELKQHILKSREAMHVL